MAETSVNSSPSQQSAAQKLEGVGFTFCKCATVALICGRFALPVAALLAAGFFIAAAIKGQKETRCFAGRPVTIAVLWILGASVWIWFHVVPAGMAVRSAAFPWLNPQ